MTEQLFTTEDAAEFLRVHVETVRFWIRTGRLAAVKVGRGWRIRRGDLDRIAEHGTVEPGQVKETVTQ